MIPRPITILHDTASGSIPRTLEEEFFHDRCIFCNGEITPELSNQLILQMRFLEKQDSSLPITMFINSGGGSIASGLAIYDVMTTLSCDVNTVCTSLAASMASILFASGKHRTIYPSAEVMIHDPLVLGMSGGSALQIEQTSQKLLKLRKKLADILASHTGHSRKEILNLTKSDTYFSSEEARSFGIADEINTL